MYWIAGDQPESEANGLHNLGTYYLWTTIRGSILDLDLAVPGFEKAARLVLLQRPTWVTSIPVYSR